MHATYVKVDNCGVTGANWDGFWRKTQGTRVCHVHNCLNSSLASFSAIKKAFNPDRKALLVTLHTTAWCMLQRHQWDTIFVYKARVILLFSENLLNNLSRVAMRGELVGHSPDNNSRSRLLWLVYSTLLHSRLPKIKLCLKRPVSLFALAWRHVKISIFQILFDNVQEHDFARPGLVNSQHLPSISVHFDHGSH